MDNDASSYNSPDFVFAKGVPDNPGETMPARVGAPAPSFEALSLDGGTVRLSDLKGRYVVVMTGAVTSPMCSHEVPALNKLQDDFGGQGVSFFLLYTRESHPAENYPAHASMEQKIAHARDLHRLEGVRVPVLVDSLDGAIHRSYGAWPAALFVIDRNGRLVYRANMANTLELRQLLEDLIEGDRQAAQGEVLHGQYSERLVPHLADKDTHHRVYERAGPKAFEDHWVRSPHQRGLWP
ncbi:MAG: Peroxiredoxin [Chloroflexi bacterium]|nr:MAG: Peroxiredoxin [Chloroflexota bacterium]